MKDKRKKQKFLILIVLREMHMNVYIKSN